MINLLKKIRKIESCMIYYFIINFGLYLLWIKLIWKYDKGLLLDNLIIFIIVLAFMLTSKFFLYTYLAKINVEKKNLEERNKSIPILTNIIEEIKCKQHDFKNYLTTINGIIEVAKEREIRYELKKYIQTVKHINKGMIYDILYLDNIIIKSILYDKLCEGDKSNIKFSFNIKSNFLNSSLDDYEISNLLNNLLNNAFEALKDIDRNEKMVVLNIFNEESKKIIEVKNSGVKIKPESIKCIFNKGFSTKQEKNRGYGLYNVKRIVESRGGKIQLSFVDNYTVFRIEFN